MPVDIREANRTWEALLAAHSTLMRGFSDEAIWREHHLTMREYDVLYTLSKHGAPARIGDLHKSVLLSQPALSRLVDRLVARGLIERATDKHDGRAVRISLTEVGADLQRTVGMAHARSVARAMRALEPSEQRELARLSTKLITHSQETN